MPTLYFHRKVNRFWPAATVRGQIDLALKKYKVRYTLERTEKGWDITAEVANKHVENVTEVLANRFSPPWQPVEQAVVETHAAPAEPEPIAEVNTVFKPELFSRLYGLDAHIRRVTDSITLGATTNWTKREHTLLAGPPGCGKTELMRTLASGLGREGEAYNMYDATSTTKAGVLEQLMKAKSIPPILFVEEIEKAPESALRWLLGVMDVRGEVRRTNYRVGNQQKAVKLLVIASANNIKLLSELDSGAIFSRFSNRIHCPLPTPENAHKIFLREVTDIGGDPRWADEVMQYYGTGTNYGQEHDIRECRSILLCGRDRLLDGSFHADYKATKLELKNDR